MESWSYVFGEKGSISHTPLSPSGSYARNSKLPYTFGNNMFVSVPQTIENHAFEEFGYGDLVSKQLTNGSIGDVLNNKVSGERSVNPLMATLNVISGEDESTAKLSTSAMDSNSWDSSLIDLKLGRFVDAQNSSFSTGVGAPILSSSELSIPTKRARSAGINAHTTYCQVYGCNKDLTSSKDYHKRHKVCEIHSKTAKVIVNGIEQRFCQQCSRFHLLSEFDDGKRSCRKRLAGHNERRRKPQVHSGRTGRLIQQYKGYGGGRFPGTMLTTTSFICQDILPSSLLHSDKHVTNEWGKRVKVEDRTDYSPLSAIPITNGSSFKSSYPPNSIEKLFPSFQDNLVNTATGGILNEKYPHDFGSSNFRSRPLFRDTSLESGDVNVYDAASTTRGLSGNSDSGCALSLLSSSQNSSSHSSGFPMSRSLIIPSSHAQCDMSQVSENLIGIISQASTTLVSNKFSSSGINSTEGSQLGPLLMSDGGEAANFGIGDEIYHGSEFLNTKDRLSCEDGMTIDLLQLSSQLQRVEHQRQSMQVKQESEGFYCHRIT